MLSPHPALPAPTRTWVLMFGLNAPLPIAIRTSPQSANLSLAIVAWPTAMMEPPAKTIFRWPKWASAKYPPIRGVK